MEKNRIDANIRCPSCNGQLYPRVLVCDSCGLKVEGEFVENEFGALTPDELHFLRVFIFCEGRIRDMEAALGVSYPTVKAHLASIRGKLNLTGPKFAGGIPLPARDQGEGAPGRETEEVLAGLENGTITYKEALKLLKSRKKGNTDGDEH
jgi:hypothetical protein